MYYVLLIYSVGLTQIELSSVHSVFTLNSVRGFSIIFTYFSFTVRFLEQRCCSGFKQTFFETE